MAAAQHSQIMDGFREKLEINVCNKQKLGSNDKQICARVEKILMDSIKVENRLASQLRDDMLSTLKFSVKFGVADNRVKHAF